jgi:predicted nucleotidyltransferase component of viral defense system
VDKRNYYYQQVQLLLQLIPFVAKHECFALKGGAAINLFIRDLPRLSVDIDLVFMPMMERKQALTVIRTALSKIRVNPRPAAGGDISGESRKRP